MLLMLAVKKPGNDLCKQNLIYFCLLNWKQKLHTESPGPGSE